MSVVNLLYSALETGDWEAVSEVYFILSGERVDIPEPEPLDESTAMLKSMMDRLEKLERQDPPKKNTKRGRPRKKAIKKTNDQVAENFMMKPERTTNTVKASTKQNKFEKMMDIDLEDDEDGNYDLVNNNVKPTPRNREGFSMKTVFCQDCQKNIEVHPMFAKEPYSCDIVKCGKKCPNKT